MLRFKEINIERDYELCLKMQKDVLLCSFGSLAGYEKQLAAYKKRLLIRQRHPDFYQYHIWFKGKIIGQLDFSTCYEPETGYVRLLYLLPQYRGTGLADKVDAFIRSKMLEQGCMRVLLTVSRSNKRALRFYSKHGWRCVRKNERIVRTDLWALELS